MTKTFRNSFSLEIIAAIIVLASSFMWLTAKNDNDMELGSRADLTPGGISQPLQPGFTKIEPSESIFSPEILPSNGQTAPLSPQPAPTASPVPDGSSVQPFEPPYCVDNSATSKCDEIQCLHQTQFCPPPLRE